MDPRDSTDELRDLLAQGREVSADLLSRLDQDADPVEIVSLLESLALVDERRQRVLDELRKEASSLRRREEDRSIRQFVLRALDELKVPQTPAFLEDYLYATELIEVKSRGMGALRRDEYRAWDRRRDRPRLAYVVPCLDEQGRPVPRWMGRSDWPLSQRILVDDAEELWKLRGVAAVTDAYRRAEGPTRSLFIPVIERLAWEVLGPEEVEPDLDDASIDAVDSAVRSREVKVAPRVTKAQERVVARLGEFDEAERFWGVRTREQAVAGNVRTSADA
jgi:hypothetical protein